MPAPQHRQITILPLNDDREHYREVRKGTQRLVMPTTELQELLLLLQNASAKLFGLDVKVPKEKTEGSGPGGVG